jgi:hypothetical protein
MGTPIGGVRGVLRRQLKKAYKYGNRELANKLSAELASINIQRGMAGLSAFGSADENKKELAAYRFQQTEKANATVSELQKARAAAEKAKQDGAAAPVAGAVTPRLDAAAADAAPIPGAVTPRLDADAAPIPGAVTPRLDAAADANPVAGAVTPRLDANPVKKPATPAKPAKPASRVLSPGSATIASDAEFPGNSESDNPVMTKGHDSGARPDLTIKPEDKTTGTINDPALREKKDTTTGSTTPTETVPDVVGAGSGDTPETDGKTPEGMINPQGLGWMTASEATRQSKRRGDINAGILPDDYTSEELKSFEILHGNEAMVAEITKRVDAAAAARPARLAEEAARGVAWEETKRLRAVEEARVDNLESVKRLGTGLLNKVRDTAGDFVDGAVGAAKIAASEVGTVAKAAGEAAGEVLNRKIVAPKVLDAETERRRAELKKTRYNEWGDVNASRKQRKGATIFSIEEGGVDGLLKRENNIRSFVEDPNVGVQMLGRAEDEAEAFKGESKHNIRRRMAEARLAEIQSQVDAAKELRSGVLSERDFEAGKASGESLVGSAKDAINRLRSRIGGGDTSDEAAQPPEKRTPNSILDLATSPEERSELEKAREVPVVDPTTVVGSPPVVGSPAVVDPTTTIGTGASVSPVTPSVVPPAGSTGAAPLPPGTLPNAEPAIGVGDFGPAEGVAPAPTTGGFDANSKDYDDATAAAAGLKRDDAGHMGSLDPRTGMVLKGRDHPTWDKMYWAEKELGNTIVKAADGRYYSRGGGKLEPGDQAVDAPLGPPPAVPLPLATLPTRGSDLEKARLAPVDGGTPVAGSPAVVDPTTTVGTGASVSPVAPSVVTSADGTGAAATGLPPATLPNAEPDVGKVPFLEEQRGVEAGTPAVTPEELFEDVHKSEFDPASRVDREKMDALKAEHYPGLAADTKVTTADPAAATPPAVTPTPVGTGAPAPAAAAGEPIQLVAGNPDTTFGAGKPNSATLDARVLPKVFVQKDGSPSTVNTISIGKKGNVILIPTVVNGEQLTEKAAREEYNKTKNHYGIYKTVKEANAAAGALSKAHGAALEETAWVKLTPKGNEVKNKVPRKDPKTGKNRLAALRYNNPGAAWPSKHDVAFGIQGYGWLNDKDPGGNNIGYFPTPTHGGGANLALWNRGYVNGTMKENNPMYKSGRDGKGGKILVAEDRLGTSLTVKEAIAKWRGRIGTPTPKSFKNIEDQDMPADMLDDPKVAIDLFRQMAAHETGTGTGKKALAYKDGKMTRSEWLRSWKMMQAGGAGKRFTPKSEKQAKLIAAFEKSIVDEKKLAKK